MSENKHTEAAIISALKQVEAGRKVEDVARGRVFPNPWSMPRRPSTAAWDVSEAEEGKHLRDKNARLKKLAADLSLDKDMLQSLIRRLPGSHPRNVDLLLGTPS